MASFRQQLRYLLYRNYLIKINDPKVLFQEFFLPCIVVVSLFTYTAFNKVEVYPAEPYDNFNNYDLLSTNGSVSFLPNGLQPWAFTPNTNATRRVMDAIQEDFGDAAPSQFLPFASEMEMEDNYRLSKDPSFTVAIVFPAEFPQNLTVVIRMPFEQMPSTGQDNRFAAQDKCRSTLGQAPGLVENNCPANRYLYSGFAALQVVLQNAVSKVLTNQSLPLPEVSVRMFPKPEYVEGSAFVRTISSIYLVLMYAGFIGTLLSLIVFEKEKKIKETMLMMGMSSGAFWLSWFIIYSIIIFTVSLLVAILTKYAVRLFINGNLLIIILSMFFYGMSIICLSFMLTSFFNKALTAGVVGTLSTMVLSLLYLPLSLISGVPLVVKWILSFLSPIAFALTVDQAVALDQEGTGVQFSNLGPDGFPPYFAMLAIDALLYLLLAFYFDNVIPGMYGQRKPLWFLCLPSYWSRRSHVTASDELEIEDNLEDVETVSPELRTRPSIRIRNLSKSFSAGRGKPDVQAVKGMSLDMYEGQITCLLGHNGAGKTTLINTLTGLITANSGHASILGYDVTDPIQMQSIRSMMGVCSQDNTLFEHLSPQEHLTVYAGIKGVPSQDISSEVEKILELTQLKESANTKAKNLSGGQKRKLCVGNALIGNPKVLFLDEPSSGMDPYSRRLLWNLLKKQRQGRVTVLTTHFMDEADILADRKAMMSKGTLRCYGSSLFLKTRFGIGYHLGMVVKQDIDVNTITDLVKTHITDAKMSRSHGMELAYTLPLQDTDKFPGLFRALEGTTGSGTVAKQLGIQSYGVSMTTLEEVFLKLNEEEEADNDDDGQEPVAVSDMSPINPTTATSPLTYTTETVSLDANHLIKKPLQPGKHQMKAFMRTLITQMLRNPAVYVTRIIMPILYMIISFVLATVVSVGPDIIEDPFRLTLDPKLYLDTTTPSSLDQLTPLLYQDNLTSGQDIGLLVQFERMGIVSDATTNISQLMSLAPHSMATVAINFGAMGEPPSFLALYNDTALHSLPVLLSILSNVLVPIEAPTQDLLNMTIVNHPLPTRAREFTYNSGFFLMLFMGMSFCFSPMGFAVNITKERQDKVRTQLRVSGLTVGNYWLSHLILDILQMYLLLIAALIMIGVSSGMDVTLSLATGGGMFMFTVFIIVFAPLIVLWTYCVSFLFDDHKTFESYATLLYFYMPLFLFAPVLALDYTGNATAAIVIHIVVIFVYPLYSIFGMLLYIDKIYQVALAMQKLDQLTFGDYFAFDNMMVPTLICVMLCLVLVFFLLRFVEIKATGGNWKDTFMFSEGKVGTVLPNNDNIPDEDSDVAEERQKVRTMFSQGIGNQDCVVAALGIRKEFQKNNGACGSCGKKDASTNVAVRNLTLGVNTGEVMGLLGPNGAGKTTAMNVITADTKATRGQIKIAGYDITSSLSEAFHSMGFCPQHDPLFENITLREHIQMYALLKGIHADDVKAITNHYMETLKITEHADKKAQKLSGGTKRKLCFAISMLGNPKVVLLDEPSTGMDPASKRFVWNTIIASFRDDRGAILTTHSMEEADAVCSRVGIMISGRLVCLGSTQHLKSKYGGGYILEVKLNPGESYYAMDHASNQAKQLIDQLLTGLDDVIKGIFPRAEVTETFGERVTYKIPSETDIQLSRVFAALEEGKSGLNIEEYSFSQATLEQVFIEFARKQRSEEEEENAIPSRQSSPNHHPSPTRNQSQLAV